MTTRSVRIVAACAACVAVPRRDVTGGGETVCTHEARPGLAVTVRDSAPGAPVADAPAVARAGTAADTARGGFAVDADAVYSLAYERPDTYAVRVERAGYRPWERVGVAVAGGQCHVRTVALTARLQR